MSDIAFNDFSTEVSKMSLPQLEALLLVIQTLISKAKQDKEASIANIDIPPNKRAFFNAIGKISFDAEAVNKLRNESII